MEIEKKSNLSSLFICSHCKVYIAEDNFCTCRKINYCCQECLEDDSAYHRLECETHKNCDIKVLPSSIIGSSLIRSSSTFPVSMEGFNSKYLGLVHCLLLSCPVHLELGLNEEKSQSEIEEPEQNFDNESVENDNSVD